MTSKLAQLRRWENLNAAPVPCRIARLISEVPEPYGAAIGALLDRNLSNVQVAQRITKAGFGVADTTVRRHRKKICTCYRGTTEYGSLEELLA